MSTEPVIDIKKSSALPYWFYAVSALLFCAISWVARGVGAWVWVTVGMFAAGLAFVIAASLLIAQERKAADWFRNLHRLAWFTMAAAVAGFLIRVAFATGAICVENASDTDVRIVVDGNDWLDIPAHSVKMTNLSRGEHVVAVFTPNGELKLDEHPANVVPCGKHVLNVFGAQTYYHGEMVYGKLAPMKSKVVKDKWIEIEVDYFLKDPPEEMMVWTDRGRPYEFPKVSFLLRADPFPQPKK